MRLTAPFCVALREFDVHPCETTDRVAVSGAIARIQEKGHHLPEVRRSRVAREVLDTERPHILAHTPKEGSRR